MYTLIIIVTVYGAVAIKTIDFATENKCISAAKQLVAFNTKVVCIEK